LKSFVGSVTFVYKNNYFTAYFLQYLTRSALTIVNINGADVSPKGKTVKQKYSVSPLISHAKDMYS